MSEASPAAIRWAQKGDYASLGGLDAKILPTYRDHDGNSVLSVAALNGKEATCKAILASCKALLYDRNKKGSTALHHAASGNHSRTLRYLISVASEAENRAKQDDLEKGRDGAKLLTRADNDGRTALHSAAREGHCGCVAVLMKAGELLRAVDNDGRTALHSAAREGHCRCVDVLIKADKDGELLRAVDNDGRTALHLAVESGVSKAVEKITDEKRVSLLSKADKNGHTAMHLAVKQQNKEIVDLLAKAEPELEYCANSSGETPHLIAFKKVLDGDPGAVAINKIILRCQERIDEDGRNFLHILADKPQHVEVDKPEHAVEEYSLGLNDIDPKMLNKKDNEGNSPLRIAVERENKNLARAFLYHNGVGPEIKKEIGQMSFAKIKFEYDKKKAGTFGQCPEDDLKKMIEIIYETEVKDEANVDLVVSTLIATVSFAAGISVPGGYTGEGSNQGTAVLAPKTSFKVFMVSDVIALLLSLYAVLGHLVAKHMKNEEDMRHQVKEARCCSVVAIFAMVIAFTSGVYAVLAVTKVFAAIVPALCAMFFLFGLIPLWRIKDTVYCQILLPMRNRLFCQTKSDSGRAEPPPDLPSASH